MTDEVIWLSSLGFHPDRVNLNQLNYEHVRRFGYATTAMIEGKKKFIGWC